VSFIVTTLAKGKTPTTCIVYCFLARHAVEIIAMLGVGLVVLS
jgi:hypothetical protein